MIEENVYLLLGSNLGDPLKNLAMCLPKIEKYIGRIKQRSSVYETTAWGKTDQPNFLNQALQVATPLQAADVLTKIHAIEKSLGRTRKIKWDARIIDIDIIYFGNDIIETSQLTVPHPHIAQRRFALVPLTEISPEFIHPIWNKTNAQLLNACQDPLEVRITS
jgi:2-amino-4-hydroxy-6-hydroxymethyldihydropteridine diphosphokinase